MRYTRKAGTKQLVSLPRGYGQVGLVGMFWCVGVGVGVWVCVGNMGYKGRGLGIGLKKSNSITPHQYYLIKLLRQ